MNNMPRFHSKSFWNFSLSFYADDAVKEACLKAQDTLGADVNIILLCVWLDRQSLLIPPKAKADLIAASHEVQTAIMHPLRQNRRQLSKGTGAYQQALLLELEAEKNAQARYVGILNEYAASFTAQESGKNGNLAWYQNHLNADQDFPAFITAASHFKPASG